ncbi:MAG TPA: Uma2 family endonuclease [Thermoanaerobaculia bacterium]
MNAIPLLEDETYYPDSDGEPVAETPVHLEEMIYVFEVLAGRFRNDPDVFVGANMFLYYRKSDPRGGVAPDGFVVKGVPKLLPGGEQRRTYKLWEEGQVPCFVLETTSKGTAEEDKNKRKTYAQLGVAEYFQFDPFGEYLSPPLQGFHLVKGVYKPVRPNPGGALESRTLGVLFRAAGKRLRLTDTKTGALLLRREEVDEKAEAEAQRADAEAQRADAEAQRADAEKQRADAEALARRALEEELARLRRTLGGS